MEVLPGLRPAKPAIEPSRPAERYNADGARDGAHFEEHLNQVREPRGQRNEPSRAEDSVSRARPDTELDTGRDRRGPAQAIEEAGAQAAPATEPGAPDSQAQPAQELAQGVEAPPADRSRPEPVAEVASSTPAAAAEAAPTLSIETPKPAIAPQSLSGAPAQVDNSAIAGAFSAAVQTQQGAASVEVDTPVLGVAIEPMLVGEAPKSAAADGSTTVAQRPDPSATLAIEAFAGATPTSASAPQDFVADLARSIEAQDAKAPSPPHVHPASESAAEILRQVRVGLSTDLREANIQLAPEALGRVWIRMRVEHGTLRADVRAETSQALRALELHAPELKAALAQHGIEPRTIAFSLSNSHTGDAPGRGHPSPSRSPRASFAPVELPPAALERALARRLSAGGVDTYA